MKTHRIVSVVMAAVFFVSGCSTLSTISATQPGVSVRINEKAPAPAPVKHEFSVRALGSDFFAAKKDGAEPLYGVVPLQVNIGYIILDALFLAPLILWNARGAYPFYEIDYDRAIIRYSEDGKTWGQYSILREEMEYAKSYYTSPEIMALGTVQK